LGTGTIVSVDADKAREARNLLLKPKIVEMTFDDLRKVFRENRARGWTDSGVAAPEQSECTGSAEVLKLRAGAAPSTVNRRLTFVPKKQSGSAWVW
jgi:hypothetical protein